MLSINPNVSNEIQLLFEKLLKLYPCKWNNNNIIILEKFCIEPPYTTVTALTDKIDEAGMNNVVRVVIN